MERRSRPSGFGRTLRQVVAGAAVAFILTGPTAAAQPLPQVDQSFTGPPVGGATINDCCNYTGRPLRQVATGCWRA